VNLDQHERCVDRAIDHVNVAWKCLDAASNDLQQLGLRDAANAARDALQPVFHVATLLEISG
jgi:hypothetical protein